VTRLKGGIHPDSIRSASVDITLATLATNTFSNAILVNEPGHIVSVTVGFFTIYRNSASGAEHAQVLIPVDSRTAGWYLPVPVGFSLFTLPGFTSSDLGKGGFNSVSAYDDGRSYIATGAVGAHQPSWTLPPDLFGLFFDGGLFVEMNAPNKHFGIRVTVNYVPRAQFSPAFPDPVQVLQHYWNCAHNEVEFLEGFYGGMTFDVDSSVIASGSGPPPRSSYSTTPGDPLSSYHTLLG